MFFTFNGLSLKQKFYRGAIVGIAIFAVVSLIFSNHEFKSQAQSKEAAAPQVVFTNPAAITIPSSGPATPYPSAITVSGVPGTIPATPGSVKVTINGYSHTFPDDVGFVLVGPTGAAFNIADGAGDGTDMVNITFTISDTGATQLPTAPNWPAGTYRPANYYSDVYPAPGPGSTYANPGPLGGGTATFSSVYGGTNPNGVWNLYVVDFVGGDTGSISGGWSLEIVAATPAGDAPMDINADGKSDYVVVRNVGGGPGGQLRWFYNTNGTGAPTVALDWGLQGDEFTPVDFDGDDKDDIGVWRASPSLGVGPGTFYILNSATNTACVEEFGIATDDPTVVGDYNGDGKADLAVYRSGAASGDQSTWFYRGACSNPLGGNITYVPWGQNGDFPAPGDYDGDGKYDFVVQRNNGGGQAAFWRLFSAGGIDTKIFGAATDTIVPGDWDGDGKCDIATVRGNAGQIEWRYLSSATSSIHYFTFGLSASDFPTQGDYDGDGKTDPALWRPNALPFNSGFWVYNSTNGAVQTFAIGQNGDYPPGNFNSH